jgi:cytochrome c
MTRSIPLLFSSALLSVATVVMLGGPAQATDPVGDVQAAEGAKLYGTYCGKCHGDGGKGSKKGPPVVGSAALPLDPPAGAKVRKSQFRTAQDVAAFVATNMPANKPGSLTVDQYYQILAFDLKANGVDVSKQKLDAKTAAEIKLH